MCTFFFKNLLIFFKENLSQSSSSIKKITKVSVLDVKRSNNTGILSFISFLGFYKQYFNSLLAILLAQFRMSFTEIKDAILSMNSAALTSEKLISLKSMFFRFSDNEVQEPN